MEKVTISKTLFIGLGGFGADTIVRFKSLMLDNFGEIPPMIKFLAIDDSHYSKKSYKNIHGKEISLDENEFCILDIFNTVKNQKKIVSSYPKIDSSVPDQVIRYLEFEFALSAKMQGPKIRYDRPIQRYTFLVDVNNIIHSRLSNLIDDINIADLLDNDKYTTQLNEPLNVFVAFSLAGATGSGLFIDLPLFLKGTGIVSQNTRINAIGLLPDVYASLGVMAVNCPPNAITGITEYELIADGMLQEFIPDPSHPARLVKTPAGSYPVDPANLYDDFYLINNVSSTGVKYETAKEIADIVSKSFFLEIGRQEDEDEMGKLLKEKEKHFEKINQRIKDKTLIYNGIGYAEMIFDPKQVAAYYSLMQANSICMNLLGSVQTNLNINEDIQILLDEWKIQEDQNRDDVINFLSEPKPKQRFSGVHEFDENAATAMSSKKGEYISAVRKGLVASIHDDQGKLDQLLGRSLNNLQTFVTGKINTPGGLDYIKKVFPELIGRLHRMMDEMNSERKDFEEKHSRLENTFEIQLSNIRDAANISRINVFKIRTKAIQAAYEEFVNTVNTEALYIHEIERRTAAIAFYRKMIDRSEGILNKVIGFEDRLRKALENTARVIQQIKSRNPKEPFTIHVTPEYISSMEFDQGDVDIVSFLQKVKLSSLVLQGEMEVNELFSKITGYTSSLEKTNAYKETTILDILQKMPPERVRELFLKLKSSIGILRRLDPNYPIDNVRAYVIGVFDVDHPAIIDQSKAKVDDADGESDIAYDLVHYAGESGETGKKSKKIIPTPGDILRSEFKFNGITPGLSNTKDPNKIMIVSYESAVPAFLIKNFKKYAFDMEHKKERIAEELRYSNKHWGEIIMKNNYSIFPEQEEDDDL